MACTECSRSVFFKTHGVCRGAWPTHPPWRRALSTMLFFTTSLEYCIKKPLVLERTCCKTYTPGTSIPGMSCKKYTPGTFPSPGLKFYNPNGVWFPGYIFSNKLAPGTFPEVPGMYFLQYTPGTEVPGVYFLQHMGCTECSRSAFFTTHAFDAVLLECIFYNK